MSETTRSRTVRSFLEALLQWSPGEWMVLVYFLGPEAPLRPTRLRYFHGIGASLPRVSQLSSSRTALPSGAIFTQFNADEPEADKDIADALDVCASLAPVGNAAMCRILEDALAACYVLSRMDGCLLSELEEAFRGVLLKKSLPAVTAIVAQGVQRLEEWHTTNLAAIC